MKLTIALPTAAPITEQVTEVSAGTLYVQHTNYEVYDSLEDAWIQYVVGGNTYYWSLKTGETSSTLPSGTVEMADGAIVTLIQGNEGS